jgi:hypothetical protein
MQLAAVDGEQIRTFHDGLLRTFVLVTARILIEWTPWCNSIRSTRLCAVELGTSARVIVRSGYVIHLSRYAIEESIAIVSHLVHIEVRPARQEDELRIAAQAVERCLQAGRRSIQIERVVCADEEMNLSFEVRTNGFPIALQPTDDIVVSTPIGCDRRIDLSRDTVE